jgi:hypothetical protein
LAYIRPSWRRDFLPLRFWGDKENRTYRDADRLLALLRDDFGYQGVIPFYVTDDPDLARYRALAASMTSSSPPSGTGTKGGFQGSLAAELPLVGTDDPLEDFNGDFL